MPKASNLEGVIGNNSTRQTFLSVSLLYMKTYTITQNYVSKFVKREIDKLVLKTLNSLGLLNAKTLEVGSPLTKLLVEDKEKFEHCT